MAARNGKGSIGVLTTIAAPGHNQIEKQKKDQIEKQKKAGSFLPAF
jgi:hypothetical protein